MKRRAVVVITQATYRYGGDLFAQAFANCLSDFGFESSVRTREEAPSLRKKDLLVLTQTGVFARLQKNPARKVMYLFHPVCPTMSYGRFAKRSFANVKKAWDRHGVEAIFDYNPQTTKWLKAAGMNAFFLPVGYHPFFEVPESTPPLPGNPGVYFIGRAKGKRGQYARNCKALVFSNAENIFRRQRILRTDGVHLNFLGYTGFRTFLSLRVIMLLLSNRRAVVSELGDWSPLNHEEHWLVGVSKRMPGYCKHLLLKPKERHAMANRGYEFVKKHYRLKPFIEKAFTEAKIL